MCATGPASQGLRVVVASGRAFWRGQPQVHDVGGGGEQIPGDGIRRNRQTKTVLLEQGVHIAGMPGGVLKLEHIAEFIGQAPGELFQTS